MPVSMFGIRDRESYYQEEANSTCNRTLRAHTEHAVVARVRSAPDAAYIAHIAAGAAGEVRERDAPRQFLLASIFVSNGTVSFLGQCVVAGSFEVLLRRRGEVAILLSNRGSLDLTYGLSVRLVSISDPTAEVFFP